MTTHAMRCIDKAGGLDEWLLSSKHVDESLVGCRLRAMIRDKLDSDPNIPRPKPFVRLPRNRAKELAEAESVDLANAELRAQEKGVVSDSDISKLTTA